MAGIEKFWDDDPTSLLRVHDGFVLDEDRAADTPGFSGKKKDAEKALAEGAEVLSDLQDMFFAASTLGARGSILLVLQAMDTAGKGGITKHVMGAVAPGGIAYHAFKAPTAEERAHDFLWRINRELPPAGQIGVFDRSHYEDVLIGSVRQLAPPAEIDERFVAINNFERRLTETGTTVIKVMLHISSDEQKERLSARLDRPDKHWKYNPSDVDERMRWAEYQKAYQRVFDLTSTANAPWYVVPGNHKWYARLAVQHLLIDALRDIDPAYPTADYDVELEKKRLAAT
ncbi:PPK2 family polyphosphate kinase [Glaciibacter flavus]|uniref:PPK2 family polyphosphate kinase n=1 Tax=Orlajensenia flava TaxID=2565934 RepID=UPI003AFFF049